MGMIDQQPNAALATEHQDTIAPMEADMPQEHTIMLSDHNHTQNPNEGSVPPMTPERKIQEALIIALRARSNEPHDQDIEIARVRFCADVTSYCRAKGWLTDSQYIVVRVWIPHRPGYIRISETEIWVEKPKCIPVVFENKTPVTGGADFHGDRDLDVPVDEELRKEFLRLSLESEHPLYTPGKTVLPPGAKLGPPPDLVDHDSVKRAIEAVNQTRTG